MHARPMHGKGVTKGAAHVLGGPENMSKKLMVGLMPLAHSPAETDRAAIGGVKTREHLRFPH